MLETLLSGGLTGLIGTIWGGILKLKHKKLEIEERDKQRQHDLAMVAAETDAMIKEAEAEIRTVEARVAGSIELAETQAFTQSLEAGRVRVFDAAYMDKLFTAEGWVRLFAIPAGVLLAVLFGLVDFVKEMARPGITAYLLGISTWITIQAWDLLGRINGDAITAAMAIAIVSDAINVVLYLTVTAATWWFGDRMAAKGMAKDLKLRGI